MACSFCRRRKIKCDGARPCCGTCAEAGRTCAYTAVSEAENESLRLAKRARRSKLAAMEILEEPALQRVIADQRTLAAAGMALAATAATGSGSTEDGAPLVDPFWLTRAAQAGRLLARPPSPADRALVAAVAAQLPSPAPSAAGLTTTPFDDIAVLPPAEPASADDAAFPDAATSSPPYAGAMSRGASEQPHDANAAAGPGSDGAFSQFGTAVRPSVLASPLSRPSALHPLRLSSAPLGGSAGAFGPGSGAFGAGSAPADLGVPKGFVSTAPYPHHARGDRDYSSTGAYRRRSSLSLSPRSLGPVPPTRAHAHAAPALCLPPSITEGVAVGPGPGHAHTADATMDIDAEPPTSTSPALSSTSASASASACASACAGAGTGIGPTRRTVRRSRSNTATLGHGHGHGHGHGDEAGDAKGTHAATPVQQANKPYSKPIFRAAGPHGHLVAMGRPRAHTTNSSAAAHAMGGAHGASVAGMAQVAGAGMGMHPAQQRPRGRMLQRPLSVNMDRFDGASAPGSALAYHSPGIGLGVSPFSGAGMSTSMPMPSHVAMLSAAAAAQDAYSHRTSSPSPHLDLLSLGSVNVNGNGNGAPGMAAFRSDWNSSTGSLQLQSAASHGHGHGHALAFTTTPGLDASHGANVDAHAQHMLAPVAVPASASAASDAAAALPYLSPCALDAFDDFDTASSFGGPSTSASASPTVDAFGDAGHFLEPDSGASASAGASAGGSASVSTSASAGHPSIPHSPAHAAWRELIAPSAPLKLDAAYAHPLSLSLPLSGQDHDHDAWMHVPGLSYPDDAPSPLSFAATGMGMSMGTGDAHGLGLSLAPSAAQQQHPLHLQYSSMSLASGGGGSPSPVAAGGIAPSSGFPWTPTQAPVSAMPMALHQPVLSPSPLKLEATLADQPPQALLQGASSLGLYVS